MPDFELFLLPFFTGLVLALMLPALGAYLRLRNEWLAALSYPHVAAAGTLGAVFLGLSPLLGGLAMAGLAGAGKRLLARRLSGDVCHALFLLAGWSTTVLVTANQPTAERLGHALFDGQLYFAGVVELLSAVLGSVLVLSALRFASSRLLLLRLYPDFSRLRGLTVWPLELAFDVLAALALALATMSLGVMATFSLVFVPPWLAFRRMGTWRGGLGLAMLLGSLAYVLAFALALLLDQPFGAVFGLLQVLFSLIIA